MTNDELNAIIADQLELPKVVEHQEYYCSPTDIRRIVNRALRSVSATSNRGGNFLDAFGACKVCDGEIPDGHTDNCDIWKLEQELNAIATIVNHPSTSSRPMYLTVKDILDAADRMRAQTSYNEQQWAAMQAYDAVRHRAEPSQEMLTRAQAIVDRGPDTRTDEQIVADGVKFIMGPVQDANHADAEKLLAKGRNLPLVPLSDAECREIEQQVRASMGAPNELVLTESEANYLTNFAIALIRAGWQAHP